MNSQTICEQLLQSLQPIALDPVRAATLQARILDSCSDSKLALQLVETGEFIALCPGIEVKRLHQAQDTMTALWRLAVGAVIPEHGHKSEEQCLVLEGELTYLGRRMLPGDFLIAKAGEKQTDIVARLPSLLLIVGEARF